MFSVLYLLKSPWKVLHFIRCLALMFFGNLGALGRGCQHFPPFPPPSLLYRTWDETVNSFSQLASPDSGLQTLVSSALRHGDGKTGGNAFQRLDWRSEPGSLPSPQRSCRRCRLGSLPLRAGILLVQSQVPRASRLGLQWKVDAKAAPGMGAFPGIFPRCLLENSRLHRLHAGSQ